MTVLPPLPDECWPIDHSCCNWGDTDPLDPPQEVRDRADALAASTLRSLTGYRVGGCPITVRPCKAGCGPQTWITYPTLGARGTAPMNAWRPVNLNGQWVNMGCGCGLPGECACGPVEQVRLDGEVGWVAEVQIDGAVLDPTAYRLDAGNLLTRIDGGGWPLCNDLTAEPGDPGYFAVTYTPGAAVDGMGAYAAGLLACQFAAACTGGACVLPTGVTSVVRQGVTYTLAAGLWAGGMTGIREVDAYIARWNPHALKGPSTVWSPDLRRPRRTPL